jgi:hypothetical protein
MHTALIKVFVAFRTPMGEQAHNALGQVYHSAASRAALRQGNSAATWDIYQLEVFEHRAGKEYQQPGNTNFSDT